MLRASMWLNRYGRQAIWSLEKDIKSLKNPLFFQKSSMPNLRGVKQPKESGKILLMSMITLKLWGWKSVWNRVEVAAMSAIITNHSAHKVWLYITIHIFWEGHIFFKKTPTLDLTDCNTRLILNCFSSEMIIEGVIKLTHA